jgi:hypothetical protein
MMNTEFARYEAVTTDQLMEQAVNIFRTENMNVMQYRAKTAGV